MKQITVPSILLACSLLFLSTTQAQDTLMIQTVGHGSVMFNYAGTIIHVDPWSNVGNYSELPDADIIAITHTHGDHYDLSAINAVKKPNTQMVFTQAVKDKGDYTDNTQVLNNWDSTVVLNVPIKAVPAYNIEGDIYHEKGVGNGYIFTFGDLKVYTAGDTENFSEMDTLGEVDIAFLPMNQPYTMVPEQAADAARRIDPDILYIYHYDAEDTATVRNMLSDEDFEIRIGPSVHYHAVAEVDQPTAENDFDHSNIPLLYPNPVSDHLLLTDCCSHAGNYSIYNAKGELMQQANLVSGQQSISVNHLDSGIYILEVVTANNKRSHKFMKM